MNIQIDIEKILGFIMLHRYDLFVRLAELTDAELRMYLVYVALAPFKSGQNRKAGIVDVTYKQLLAGPLRTWSGGSISRTMQTLIEKGFLGRVENSRLIRVNHYPLYQAKVKEMKLILSLMKPGVPLTEQDVLLAKQNMVCGLNVDRKNLAQKLTIPPSGVP